jgi:general stress protein 26
MDPTQLVRAALEAHPYGFLITTGEGGSPHARLVQHVTVATDLTLWIGTSPRSRKVEEIRRNGRATYAVEDRASFAAVVASGPATIRTELSERETHWIADFESFFPAGPSGDDFVLIRIVPDEIELIDFAHRIHPDPYGLRSQRFAREATGWVET